jgi:uncharacterized RDD family membrane protein YckC
MKCPKCGTAVDHDLKFCDYCGNPLRPLTSPPQNLSSLVPETRDRYAGFWRRLFATIIDSLIVFFVSLVLTRFLDAANILDDSAVSAPTARDALMSSAFGFVFWWIYFAGFESSVLQATPGKLVCNVMVTDSYGNRITFWRASNRYFAKMLTGLTFGLGYLCMLFTPRRQTLHDVLSGCYVMR